MRRVVSLVISLLAVVFIVMDVRWLIAPEGVAPEFGLITALFVAKGRPIIGGRHANHIGSRRNETELDRPRSTRCSQRIPSLVVDSHIPIDLGLRRLHGDVYRLQRYIGKEWLAIGEVTVDKLDRLID